MAFGQGGCEDGAGANVECDYSSARAWTDHLSAVTPLPITTPARRLHPLPYRVQDYDFGSLIILLVNSPHEIDGKSIVPASRRSETDGFLRCPVKIEPRIDAEGGTVVEESAAGPFGLGENGIGLRKRQVGESRRQ
jgi:hypothetical protein